MADTGSLPDGWRIAGLHVEGTTFKVDKGQRITDRDIARSDAIIVEYTSRRTGTSIHRTVHGAKSKRSLGTIISTQTRVVSPKGKYARDARG